MKVARQSISKRYQDFIQARIKIRKVKNEKRSDKIEEARKKESRTRPIKLKIGALISKYGGLLITEEKIERKSEEINTKSEKRSALNLSLKV